MVCHCTLAGTGACNSCSNNLYQSPIVVTFSTPPGWFDNSGRVFQLIGDELMKVDKVNIPSGAKVSGY